jgi:hypothetical protein
MNVSSETLDAFNIESFVLLSFYLILFKKSNLEVIVLYIR